MNHADANNSLVKNILFFLFLFLFLTSCQEENLVSSEEGVVSVISDPIEHKVRPATPEEVQRLSKEFGLSVVGGDNEKLGACRWKDDLSGDTYGTVSCNGGRCGVVQGSNGRIGIGCFDHDDNIISSGAYRPAPEK